MAIIVTKDGKSARKVEKSPFEHEVRLQSYVYENPDSLPLYEIRDDIRLLILAREFPTSSGPIDAIGVDGDGDLYVIETKLYRNPDKRQVVAQVLDYGASLWRSSIGYPEFLEALDADSRRRHGTAVRDRLAGFFGLTQQELEETLEKMRLGLNTGSFRFVVLMDQLHDRLRDLIIFLNQNTRFDIYAVEMEHYEFDGYEIVIPKLFGAEVKKDVTGASRKRWNESLFFADARERLSPEGMQAVKDVYDSVVKYSDKVSWGTGTARGSFSPKFNKVSVRSPLTIYSDGTLVLNFGWLNSDRAEEEFRDRLKDEVERRLGLSFGQDYTTRYPTVAVSEWSPSVASLIVGLASLLEWQPHG